MIVPARVAVAPTAMRSCAGCVRKQQKDAHPPGGRPYGMSHVRSSGACQEVSLPVLYDLNLCALPKHGHLSLLHIERAGHLGLGLTREADGTVAKPL